MMSLWALLCVCVLFLSAVSLRIYLILPTCRQRAPRHLRDDRAHIMIFLGSGGHTTEMLLGLRNIDTLRYHRRTWVMGEGDGFSQEKAVKFEAQLRQRATDQGAVDEDSVRTRYGDYSLAFIPRARNVHQSLLTTPVSALRCLAACIRLLVTGGINNVAYVRQERPSHRKQDILSRTTNTSNCPNLIVTNGPGSAVILIVAAFILRFFDILSSSYNHPSNLRTTYFESWARVTGLSLSGKLLEKLVDRFVVQWPQLRDSSREYHGWLVIDERHTIGSSGSTNERYHKLAA